MDIPELSMNERIQMLYLSGRSVKHLSNRFPLKVSSINHNLEDIFELEKTAKGRKKLETLLKKLRAQDAGFKSTREQSRYQTLEEQTIRLYRSMDENYAALGIDIRQLSNKRGCLEISLRHRHIMKDSEDYLEPDSVVQDISDHIEICLRGFGDKLDRKMFEVAHQEARYIVNPLTLEARAFLKVYGENILSREVIG